MGIGFTLSLLLIATIREVFGAGQITLFPVGSFSGVIKIPVLSSFPVRIMTLAPGALLLMGLLKAYFSYKEAKK